VSRRAAALVAWLAVGHAVLMGLFWALVNTPESNVLMLAVSALIVLLLVLCAAMVEGTAGAWLLPGRTFREAIRAAPAAVPSFVLACLVFALCWWVSHRIEVWHEAHRGQIDAWSIATFDAANAVWPHRLFDALVFVVRAIVGVSLALAVLFARLEGGRPAVFRLRWVRAGLSRDQLALVALAMTLLVALPWRFSTWRPEGLPVSWVQPAFAVAKLALVYLLMNAGWALCLVAGARNASSRG
jgi:hypothetical protein